MARTLPRSDALIQYPSFDLTPVIGRQFTTAQLSDWLKASNSDELLRELAIVISERNVVFFKKQTLTIEEQKLLANKLGELSGRPEGSGLHIHPLTADDSELGNLVSVISSLTPEAKARRFGHGSQFASREWHSEFQRLLNSITFEPVPSDFAILKIHTLPEVGGDTIWASAYEAYDRLSPAFAKHLEGLTALHDASVFQTMEAVVNNTIQKGPRGHALNVGTDLRAVHPVIRTNPVTGWKGLFVNRTFTKRIIELSYDESAVILDYLFRLIMENHDLQVRYRWEKDDIAIWANSSTFHNVTRDYMGERYGNRVVSLGEKPFYDPSSVSRRTALGLPAFAG
ncbi:Taurine catabolism dioxygenase [Mycena venus]|uniref:Taurine catabolism dioxygenase n=1 Tax=Mycena venus TaxID=2733690 RepID=A0A8H7CL07_9AGAR|nr:Taurine catabolism dioxygenase [Mycena venus]